MSVRTQMIHRARVLREKRIEAFNSLGEPIIRRENPTVVHESLPCRVWDEEAMLMVGVDKTVGIGIHRIIAPWGTDVEELDMVTSVTDRRGNVLFGVIDWRVDSKYYFPTKCIVLSLESAN